MCCDEGKLMAYLDRQLAPREMEQVSLHISRCPACRARLDRLRREKDATGRLLEAYRVAAEGGLQKPVAGRMPAGSTGSTNLTVRRKGVHFVMKRYRKALAAVAAAALLIGMFSIAPVRGFASQILQVFRVNGVQVLHFDPADVQELEKALETYGKGVNIDSFGEVLREEVNDYARLDPNSVRIGSQRIGLPERLGSFEATSELGIRSGEKLSITPRVEGLNGFLANMGSQKLLPRALDGKTFSIRIYPVAVRSYGSGGSERISMYRSVSPELRVPDGVNVEEVREALLGIPILPERMRNTLAGIDPYGNTLLIPDFGMERNGPLREVKVNGNDGVFMEGPPDAYPAHRVLIWPQGGVWNALEGSFTLDQALELAGYVK